MGDERRDIDNAGGTNGQQDQAEPVSARDERRPIAPRDETEPVASPDETQPIGERRETSPAGVPGETASFVPDETQRVNPSDASPLAPAETQRVNPDDASPFAPAETQHVSLDETQPFAAAGGRGETSVMPRDVPWSGRAEVNPGRSLRDSAPYIEQPQAPEQPRPWWTPVLLGMLALGLLGVLILVAWWMDRNESVAPVESPTAGVVVPTTPAEPATQPPTAQPSTTPTAQIVQVPGLVGLPLDKAVRQLDQLGLAYRFEYRPADEPEGTVIETKPAEGQVVPMHATITLVVSTGREPSSEPPPTSTASITPG